MDGFVTLVQEFTEVLLVLVSLVINTALNLIPGDLGKAVYYLWNGIQGLGNWIGYAVAAAYFFGLEFGFADVLCEGLGYGYIVVDTLHTVVDLVDSLGGVAGLGGDAAATDAAPAAAAE